MNCATKCFFSQLFNTQSSSQLVRLIFASFCILSFVSQANADELDVWIGTGNNGIHYLTLDADSGKLSKPTLVSEIKKPGFLAMHPNGKVLYSTSGSNGGSVAAHAIGADRKLSLINELETGDGGAACVGVDQTGQVLMSAQYGGGSTTTYRIGEDDGKLIERVSVHEHGKGSGVNARRQKTAHPHWVGTSPDNSLLMVPDLGCDAVVVYQLNTKTGEATPHSRVPLPPGSGPRHMKFHTSGSFAYVLNELTLTVSVFRFNAKGGEFERVQSIQTLQDSDKDKHLNSAAEIRVHPSGKFIYTSNRGHDSITVFSVDEASGKLTFVEREHIRGAWPRNFNIDPSGKWLLAAGQHTNTLSLFEIDQESGELVYARKSVNVPSPICVLFGASK